MKGQKALMNEIYPVLASKTGTATRSTRERALGSTGKFGIRGVLPVVKCTSWPFESYLLNTHKFLPLGDEYFLSNYSCTFQFSVYNEKETILEITINAHKKLKYDPLVDCSVASLGLQTQCFFTVSQCFIRRHFVG